MGKVWRVGWLVAVFVLATLDRLRIGLRRDGARGDLFDARSVQRMRPQAVWRVAQLGDGPNRKARASRGEEPLPIDLRGGDGLGWQREALEVRYFEGVVDRGPRGAKIPVR